MEFKDELVIISYEVNVMERKYQSCEVLTVTECGARARRIAPSTLSHRARRSSTWLDRCAAGNVAIRSTLGFVQRPSNHWPFGLEWPAGIDRPSPERARDRMARDRRGGRHAGNHGVVSNVLECA